MTKYLTKQKLDIRFFGKKRYFPSMNLIRPTIIKYDVPIKLQIENDYYNDDWSIEFQYKLKTYTIFSNKEPKEDK